MEVEDHGIGDVDVECWKGTGRIGGYLDAIDRESLLRWWICLLGIADGGKGSKGVGADGLRVREYTLCQLAARDEV